MAPMKKRFITHNIQSSSRDFNKPSKSLGVYFVERYFVRIIASQYEPGPLGLFSDKRLIFFYVFF